MKIHTLGKNLVALSPWPDEGLPKHSRKLHCTAVFRTVQLSLALIVLPSPCKALQFLCLKLLYESKYKEYYFYASSMLQSTEVTITFFFNTDVEQKARPCCFTALETIDLLVLSERMQLAEVNAISQGLEVQWTRPYTICVSTSVDPSLLMINVFILRTC